ncbi:hypothetical protein B0T17DRAFT_620053 [Bombardia bombarda]|uniref:Uncharacterized protein n=1 Tax=Bombardia bombarda TaxID=252184 RepID=A0AA40BVL8_9PEZI|nr:hypothetical protein B0T17DRAFT_620053 [Bombardia bombarda]
MQLPIQLVVLSLAALTNAAALAVRQTQYKDNCWTPECADVINGNACYAMGMFNTTENILRCITQEGEPVEEVKEKLCNCYKCVGKEVEQTIESTNACAA